LEAAAARFGVRPENVFAGNGSDEVLAFAFGAFFDSSDKPLLFFFFSYSFYPVYAVFWGTPFCKIPLCDDFFINCNDYKIPSGGVIFPNPNAPTGIPVPLDEILLLAKYLEEQGRVLIVDEAYVAFGAESAVPHINKNQNLLTVHTMSKSASLAGLRFGFAIGSEELIQGLYRIKDSFNSYPIDRLALAGATAAISDSDYYDDINNKLIATRERTAQELRRLGFELLPSGANFLFVKPSGISGSDFFAKLRERGILVRHFNMERIMDYLRISIGTDEEMDVFLAHCNEIISR
jgi:histidinol-phosphate aminotransferase